nr:HNH endonuclease family protein [Amycolatopsis endophytica]
MWQQGSVSPTQANPGSDPGAARQQLAELQVKPRGTLNGYSREKYPHWDTVEGTCNTREEVLKRAGQNVVTGKDCAPTSGTWVSPYDGGTWTQASDVDIDHMVPLAQSWVSGASAWTQAQREAFANDLERPQLWAVTDNVNQSKSDRAPDEWKPPLESFWCTYATDWITVKHYYQLSVTTAEQAALTEMLDRC